MICHFTEFSNCLLYNHSMLWTKGERSKIGICDELLHAFLFHLRCPSHSLYSNEASRLSPRIKTVTTEPPTQWQHIDRLLPPAPCGAIGGSAEWSFKD